MGLARTTGPEPRRAPERCAGGRPNLPAMGSTVEFASNGNTASGHLAVPSGGTGPGLIVIQEWWGLNPQMKRTADRFAEAGFVALAPDLYHGELAGHDEMDKAGELMTNLPPDRAARDMSGAVDYLVGLDSVTGKGIGVVGFCMGGLLSFVLAALRPDRVKAAVPFYGFPQGDAEPDYSGLAAKVWGHMADPDDYFTPADARALEQKLRAMGKDVTIDIHKAGHGFMNEENPIGTHDATLATELWPKVTAFLHETLD
jgi:carboxymethylenebutenolidase